ncbi:engulfment and cell motility protein 1-like [Diadema setosum]|uniref:engulfment and cell motility protein 1-like n=1 Tax=Diadema setosum TaxID=31175 RepID=UPI003B3A220D
MTMQAQPVTLTLIDPNQRADPNIIRLAIVMDGKSGTLYCLDQSKPLKEIIEEVCSTYNISTAISDYALQGEGEKYITETNRKDLQNGEMLKLTDSPNKAALDIYNKLQSNTPEDIKPALVRLSTASTDLTFAIEFIQNHGIDLLVKMVEEGSQSGDQLALTLQSFIELMDHNVISWDTLSPNFVKKIASFMNKSGSADAQVTQRALNILESSVLNSVKLYNVIANEITFHNMAPHLENSQNQGIQQNCLALMNALCLKAPEDKKKRFEEALSAKNIRVVIMEKIIRSQNIGTEMTHQLYVFQQLTFNLLEKRRMTQIDPGSAKHKDCIEDLRSHAFGHDADITRGPSNDFKRLGFVNYQNPIKDFLDVPPGLLALECMTHFANFQNENYTRFVLENCSRADEHECPFAKSSIALTKMLCEILRVGEAPTETGAEYYPMFFSCDNAFEEFFCQCIKLFNKTWREMRASLEDFPKVMNVVQDQIERSLKVKQSSMEQMKEGLKTPSVEHYKPTTMENFWTKLQHFNYNEILKLRHQERYDKEEWNSHATPVVELRNQIKPDIMELIRQQRLVYLVEGTMFNRYNQRGRAQDRYWYCRLSPNHKMIHHGESENPQSQPTYESLTNKIPVADIQGIQTGKECQHVRNIRGEGNLAFSILYHPDHRLDFIARNQEIFDMWTDGLNVLQGKPMGSNQMGSDLEALLSMEMKIRLLDTANIPIPTEPPVIPPPPTDYNFCDSQ